MRALATLLREGNVMIVLGIAFYFVAWFASSMIADNINRMEVGKHCLLSIAREGKGDLAHSAAVDRLRPDRSAGD